jgi:excisionase family DNA binding protein
MSKDIIVDDRSPDMLTSSEAARVLHVHVNTIRRWSNQGILRAYRIGPRGDRRYRREFITKFLGELNANGVRYPSDRNECSNLLYD